jgi:hypothetical protein
MIAYVPSSRFARITLLFIVLWLVGCASSSVQRYDHQQPEFDPIAFFNGDLVAEGVVFNRSGQKTRSFVATIEAYWDDEYGFLDEVFLFSDGEEQFRLWEFERLGDQRWQGKAGDVVGPASFEHAGNAIAMDYRLRVALQSGRHITLSMEDWLYQVSADVLIAHTTMRWFGFRVGHISLTMRRLP